MAKKIRSEKEIREMLTFVRQLRKPYYFPRRGSVILHKDCWEGCLRWVLGEIECERPRVKRRVK